MSNYLILSDVGNCLLQILGDGFTADNAFKNHLQRDKIALQSPHGSMEGQLSVFLYRVVEDAQTKNQPTGYGNGGRVRKAPLTLDLHYMITPHFKDTATGNMVLGKVLSILYDNPFLYLADLLKRANAPREEVRLVLNSVPLDEMARVWEALQESYQLSICYIARVAILDSTDEHFLVPVKNKHAEYGEPLPA